MENNFQAHVSEWKEMNQTGRFAEARQYYFDQLFAEVIVNFENRVVNDWPLERPIDVLFSVLGFTPSQSSLQQEH